MIKVEVLELPICEAGYRPTAKYHFRMLEAIDHGYKVVDGVLYGVKGPLKVKRRGSQRYPTFATNWGGLQSLPVHTFAALCYYGYEVFNPNLQVRHINGDTEDISKENIVLGTSSQNQHDKTKEQRVYAAKMARKAQGKTPNNAKLNPEAVSYIRSEYSKVTGKKAPNGFASALANKFGVHVAVICNVKSGRSYV